MLLKRYDRWIEELHEVVSSKRPSLASTREMDLVAIATEILDACSDRRDQERFGVPIWESMATDLEKTTETLGPETFEQVNETVDALLLLIRQKLIQQRTKGAGHKPQKWIATKQIPFMEESTQKLVTLLDADSTLIAAWRDLITACQNENHDAYGFDQVTFFADNVLAIQRHRGHDPDRLRSTTNTAVSILMDDVFALRDVQYELGLPVPEISLKTRDQPSGLSLAARLDLAEKWIVQRPSVGDFIVWLRLENAFSIDWRGEQHGNITFYRGTPLSFKLPDHEDVRAHFVVTPEELLTEEIREFQTHKPEGIENVNEYEGFEYEPGILYARILVEQVYRHQAVSEARLLLETLLDAVNPAPKIWRLLKGHLVFQKDEEYRPLQYPSLSWGMKQERESPIFPENDRVSDSLEHLRAKGWLLSPTKARQLKPIIDLSNSLSSAKETSPEAVVLAAVRVIEHVNTWVTQGRLHWKAFIEKYFQAEFARNAFIERTDITTTSAISSNSPNLPGAGENSIQEEIRNKVFSYSSGRTFNRMTALTEVGRLKEIYQGRPLYRQLAELDEVLASGDALKDAFLEEQQRVSERIARLNRLRNAATHGGMLSKAACVSVEAFAIALAGLVLGTARRAIWEGEELTDYFEKSRLASGQRVARLVKTGELENLFVDPADKY